MAAWSKARGWVSVCDDDDKRPTSMADDTRSLAPRTRRRPILVVANPSPDSDSDSANEPSAHRPYYYPYSQNDPPSSSPPPSPSIEKAFPVRLASSREPGPLTTTNLPSHSRPHPASQSNPALSSPSGTSSPPPSTPGQSLPPTDLITDPTSRLAFSGGPSNSSDALLQQQPHTPLHGGTAGHIFGKIKAHISIPRIHHDRRLSGSPRTNPVCLSFASATPSMLTNCSVSNCLYSIRPGC
jgi:mitogen-activated protein kinase kinase kinase